MVIKPFISFVNTDTDSQLVTRTQTIYEMMDANADIYTSPSPALAVVQTSQQKFISAIAAAADGGVALTAAKNAARAELVALLRNLANYVAVACKGSMENLLLSGFPPQKNRNPIGVLPAPTNLTLNFGPRSGELESKVNPVAGAAIYNWRLSVPGQSAPLQTVQTTAARNTFTSLNPGTVYSVECNVVGSSGPSDWTDPITKMAV